MSQFITIFLSISVLVAVKNVTAIEDSRIPQQHVEEYIFEPEDFFSDDTKAKTVSDFMVDDNEIKKISHLKKRDATINIPIWNMYKDVDGNNVVPYQIHKSVKDSRVGSAIKEAAKDFEQFTCIRLKERTSEVNFINVTARKSGCWSYIGFVFKNGQEMGMESGCGSKYIAIHEFLHALGFFHEQSRPDRDSFIKVNYENIDSNMANNFNKLSIATWHNANSPYDINSILQYNSRVFSTNGKDTMTNIVEPYEALGRGRVMSEEDIRQLNLMYKCPALKQKETLCESLPTVINGEIWGDVFWPVNSKVYHNCPRHYHKVGPDYAVCQQNGVFFPSSLKCQEDIDKTCYDGESMFCLQALEENFCTKNIKYCGKTCGYCKPNEDLDLKNYCFSNTFPKVPQNGVLKLSNGGDPFTKNDFEIGEKVYFECNSGKSEGESFTTCQQNGFFSEADFKCSDDDGNDDVVCTKPPTLVGQGNLNGIKTDGYKLNDQVGVTCTEGHSVNDKSTSVCKADGSFDPAVLLCVEDETGCPSSSLPKISGVGEFDIKKTEYDVGEKVNVLCSNGTIETSTCTDQKKFVPEVVNCEQGCRNVKSKRNCESWKRRGYCYKTFVPYMKRNCNETCGYCNNVKCTTLPSLVGDGTLTHESKDSFSVGDKVTVKCSDGSEVKYGTEDEAFCTDSGKFTVDQLVCVRPEDLRCTTLPKVYGNGKTLPENKNSFLVGEKTTVKCSEGYKVKYGTPDEAICRKDEKFSVTRFTCEEVSQSDCKDIRPTRSCNKWKTKGYCTEKYTLYMKKYCAKTCGYCQDGTCDDNYSDSFCKYIETIGFCKFDNYKKSCKKTCKLC